MGKESLLRSAKDWFIDQGVQIRKTFTDSVGDYGFMVMIEGPDSRPTKLVVGAKNYPYKRGDDDVDVASFMEYKMIQRASDYGALLVLYVHSRDGFYVYDPTAFQRYGVPADDNSARSKQGEEWIDLPFRWGTSLEDWIDGYDTPQTEPTEDDPVPLFADQLAANTSTLDSYISHAAAAPAPDRSE